MPIKKTIPLGELLIQKGLVSRKDLDTALKEHQKTGQFLGSTLVRLGFMGEGELYTVLSEQLKIPYVRIKGLNIEASIIEKVPARFACHYKLMPVKFDKNTLTVAVTDPMDVRTLDDLKLLLGCDVVGVLGNE